MTASEEIDKKIEELDDWRGALLKQLRVLILSIDSEIEEEWKWETPVWSINGILCAGGIFKDHVKLNFFNGAALTDTHGLFNAGLDAAKTRAIDYSEKDKKIDEKKLKELITTAVAYNKNK